MFGLLAKAVGATILVMGLILVGEVFGQPFETSPSKTSNTMEIIFGGGLIIFAFWVLFKAPGFLIKVSRDMTKDLGESGKRILKVIEEDPKVKKAEATLSKVVDLSDLKSLSEDEMEERLWELKRIQSDVGDLPLELRNLYKWTDEPKKVEKAIYRLEREIEKQKESPAENISEEEKLKTNSKKYVHKLRP